MLLSLLGISTPFKLFWVHPKDPLMRAGAMTGWLSGRERFDGNDVEVDVEAAEETDVSGSNRMSGPSLTSRVVFAPQTAITVIIGAEFFST
jgi:hypothetical protein